MRRLAAFAAILLLPASALAQSVTLPGVPPGLFQSRAALDASGGGGGPTTCAALIAAVSNVKACFDASTGVATSGSNVTSWTDQSANAFVLGLNASSALTTPTSPVLGATSYNASLPGITLTAASNEYLATTSTGFSLGGTAATFCMAATLTSSAQSFARGLVYANGGADFNTVGNIVAIARDNLNSNLTWNYNSGTGTVYAISLSTPMRVCHVFDGANASTFLNNVLQHTDALAPSFAATGQLVMGQTYGTGTSSGWDGTVRRIVILSAAASSTDRSNIDTFLQN